MTVKIYPIQFQGGNSLTTSFKDYYKKKFIDTADNPEYSGLGERLFLNAQEIYKLINYLENETVDYDFYACTSHEHVVLYDKDYTLGGSDNAKVQIVISYVAYNGGYYHITKKLDDINKPWDSISGSAYSFADAVKMIFTLIIVQDSATIPRWKFWAKIQKILMGLKPMKRI